MGFVDFTGLEDEGHAASGTSTAADNPTQLGTEGEEDGNEDLDEEETEIPVEEKSPVETEVPNKAEDDTKTQIQENGEKFVGASGEEKVTEGKSILETSRDQKQSEGKTSSAGGRDPDQDGSGKDETAGRESPLQEQLRIFDEQVYDLWFTDMERAGLLYPNGYGSRYTGPTNRWKAYLIEVTKGASGGLDMAGTSVNGVVFQNLDRPDLPLVLALYTTEVINGKSTSVDLSVSQVYGTAEADVPVSYNNDLSYVPDSWTEIFENSSISLTTNFYTLISVGGVHNSFHSPPWLNCLLGGPFQWDNQWCWIFRFWPIIVFWIIIILSFNRR